jgi:hypothetical protein
MFLRYITNPAFQRGIEELGSHQSTVLKTMLALTRSSGTDKPMYLFFLLTKEIFAERLQYSFVTGEICIYIYIFVVYLKTLSLT